MFHRRKLSKPLDAMKICFRKFHPKRVVMLLVWGVVFLVIFHQMSIITVSFQVRQQKRRTSLYNLSAATANEIQPLKTEGNGLQVEDRVRLIRGRFRANKGYLTVGLCTVPREGAFYLPATLKSLIANLTDLEKNSTVFVLYLGSYNETWIKTVLTLVDVNYRKEVENGMIQVVQPDPQIYPDFSNISRKTYGDSIERIIWRTRQNVDYAYIFSHSREISEYYIHIEDDVYAVRGYINKIKQLVTKYENTGDLWFCLEFCRLGFIGKLFHSSDLARMKEYFLLFQFEKPGDLLINDLKSIMTQFRDIYSPVSLFKHMGKTSSLRNKTQMVSRFGEGTGTGGGWFKRKGGSYKARTSFGRSFNPPASVTTSMSPYVNHKPEDAYIITSHKFFWAKNVKKGDYYQVVLQEPSRLKAVTIRTGHPVKGYDKLQHAIVKYSTAVDEKGFCSNRRTLGQFTDGFFHYSAILSIEFRCLCIIVSKAQPGFVIINKVVMTF